MGSTAVGESAGAGHRRDQPLGRLPRGPLGALADLRRREIALVALSGVCSRSSPVGRWYLHLPSRISPDLGDPVRTAWEIAWVGHALLHDPLHVFDSNAFYPHPLSLAFSDSLWARPGRVLRVGHRRRPRPLQPAVPVRVVAVLARRLPAGARVGLGRLGGAASEAFAYAPTGSPRRAISSDLLGRPPAGPVPGARLPPGPARLVLGRLAGVRLAGQPGLHAGPAVRLSAARARR